MEEIEELRLRANECFYQDGCIEEDCFPKIPVHKHDAEHSTYKIEIENALQNYYYVSYLFRSIYDDSLERWLAVYPREQSIFLFILKILIFFY